MEYIPVIMAGLTAIILFVFGLENFSTEIEQISGERFRKFLARATRIPILGVLIGALVTAVIQSSSATSVIVVSLVNAGVLTFRNSVGVVFGANVGTTITAQLVAFKLTAFAPVFIILGFALSFVRSRVSIFGKSIFYFGFVFFSLNLISSSLEPLQNEPALKNYLLQPQNPLLAILIGGLFTAAVQSSSVTTGLAIVFVQQGLLGLENAVPLIMGANIGTTATALIAMLNMDSAAKKTALSHFIFNVGGVLIFLPALFIFGGKLNAFDNNPAIALANIHLVFNVATSLIFVLLIKPFVKLVNVLLGEDKLDFARLPVPAFDERDAFKKVTSGLRRNLGDLLSVLQESYNLVTLSIESNYRSIYDASARRIEYIGFLEKEYVGYFSRAVASVKHEKESRELLKMHRQFDYLFQIYDSIDDIFNTKKALTEHFVELESDVLLMVRKLSSETLALFEEIHRMQAGKTNAKVEARAGDLQRLLDEIDGELLPLLAEPDRADAGTISNFVTYSRRLKDKLVNFADTYGDQH
ncbi:MAG: Na/Pi cotransporter family protein [Gemmatimonadota bacterium]|nr:Na/Pi cotransporter family protein [Gemmatimonadota bacterium]